MFSPRLNILHRSQRLLWDELSLTPGEFILYGGTAIALRLGHRQSVDFDFFSFEPFAPDALLKRVPFLKGGVILQSAANTLTCRVGHQGPVQLSFFGGLSLGQVETPEPASGTSLRVASLLDLAGMRVAVVTQRAENRDYLDVHAMMAAGQSLAQMLAAAEVVYGSQFSPLVALKALAYHDDLALTRLTPAIRRDLAGAVKAVDPLSLPTLSPVRRRRE
jgi:hypothetical protein